MIKWTGLAPWEFEFPFPGCLTSTFLWGECIRGGGARGEAVHLIITMIKWIRTSWFSRQNSLSDTNRGPDTCVDDVGWVCRTLWRVHKWT